jgi:hypothetical protein
LKGSRGLWLILFHLAVDETAVTPIPLDPVVFNLFKAKRRFLFLLFRLLGTVTPP